jgi:general secretion pathway protein G
MKAQLQRFGRRGEQGFTLIELIVVMTIILILTAVAVPRFAAMVQNAREAALKQDLQVMRQAISAYTMDKGKAPQSLEDLVQSGYLHAIPVDPMTHSAKTWVTDTSDSLSDVYQSEGGIDNVHSGSDAVGSNGQPYSSW